MILISTSKVIRSFFRRYEVYAGKNIRQQTCLLFASFILQFTASLSGAKVQLAPPTENDCRKAYWPC